MKKMFYCLMLILCVLTSCSKRQEPVLEKFLHELDSQKDVFWAVDDRTIVYVDTTMTEAIEQNPHEYFSILDDGPVRGWGLHNARVSFNLTDSVHQYLADKESQKVRIRLDNGHDFGSIWVGYPVEGIPYCFGYKMGKIILTVAWMGYETTKSSGFYYDEYDDKGRNLDTQAWLAPLTPDVCRITWITMDMLETENFE